MECYKRFISARVRLLILVPMRKSEMLGSGWSEFADNWLLVPSEQPKTVTQCLYFLAIMLWNSSQIDETTPILFLALTAKHRWCWEVKLRTS